MLVADEWALVRAGRYDVGQFLQLISITAVDMNLPAVLGAAAARLQFIHEYLTDDESRLEYEHWIRERFQPALAVERREGSAAAEGIQLRAALLGLVGRVGRDPHVLSDARRRIETYLAGTHDVVIDPNMLNTLVSLAAIDGDATLYETYRARVENARTPEERYRFLYALAAFTDPALLRRTMEYALSPKVRAQDRAALVGAVLANPRGRELAWHMLQLRWNALQQDVGAFGGSSRVISALGAFCESGRAAEITAFFAAHPVASAERTLRQTLEDIEDCAQLAAAQRDGLAAWLEVSARPVRRGPWGR